MTQIGLIYPNEGFSALYTNLGWDWHMFRVNTSTTNMYVHDTNTGGGEYFLVKFMSPTGWRNGYITSGSCTSQSKSLADSAVRNTTASINGVTYAVVRARYDLNFYRGTTYAGSIPAGSELAFDIDSGGTCGATYPDRLAVSYYRVSGMSWAKVDPNADYGWVDTACDVNGYTGNWGIDHARN